MNFKQIEVSDIQPTNVRSETGFSNDVKIRHAWVKQLPDDLEELLKSKLQLADQYTKFSFYQSIDNEVSDKWLEMMRATVEANRDSMVKSESGELRLPDNLCGKADETLLLAAQEVILSMY